jgi:hypothetical protein
VERAIRSSHSYEEPGYEIYALQSRPSLTQGLGRKFTLTSPITFDELIQRVKTLFALKHVRIARPSGNDDSKTSKVRSVAVWAGSSGPQLTKVCFVVFILLLFLSPPMYKELLYDVLVACRCICHW